MPRTGSRRCAIDPSQLSSPPPFPPPDELTELVGIYDADGGLVGEARYVIGHLLGTAECALCDITHSPVRRKPAWDRMVAALPLPLRVVHRNELPGWARPAGTDAVLPAVLGRRRDNEVVEVLDRAALAACDGDVERFRAALDAALSRP